MIYRRQFVLGPGPWREYPDWSVRDLGGAGVLSACPTLPVELAIDADGGTWAVLGVALQSDPTRPDPTDEIARTPGAAVPGLALTWAGRWVLIGGGRLWPDAGGLLGCYYWHEPGEHGAASCWVSSSAGLLGQKALEHGSVRTVHRLAHSRGLDWFPPPRSAFSEVWRLLPSQSLELETGKAGPRSWLPDLVPTQSYDKALTDVCARLVTSLQRLTVRPGTAVWVPLTAGFDSRLVLAAALRAGLAVRTYTNRRRHMTLADLELPERLAAIAGVPHEWHRPRRVDPVAEQVYDEHSAGETAGVDRGYFARGQWSFAKQGDWVLRGGGFEVGRCYYRRWLPGPAEQTPAPATTIAAALGEPPGSPALSALEEWIGTARRNPVAGLDWRDRMYLEQRLGGWLSALEQSLDLALGERIHVANSAATYALLLSLPEDIRVSGQHQRDLIARLAPPLAELPFNPPEEAFPRLRRLGYRLRQDPRAFLRSALARLRAV